MPSVDAVVIGAGPAGLACAAELSKAGRAPVVLERGDSVAPAWRARYDRLRLNTGRWTSHLPRLRFPWRAGMFPSRDEVVRYLERFARKREVDVRVQTPVERVERTAGGWRIRTPGQDFEADQVVVAMGLCNHPFVPDWPGKDSFPGPLMHAHHYKNPAGFEGKSVLVVGAGSSGFEIAFDLVRGGAREVYLAVRTPPNILLRSVAGIPADPIAKLLMRLEPETADRIVHKIRRKSIGDLSSFGLPIPEDGPFVRMRRDHVAPAIVDPEVLDAVRDGAIRVVAAVRAFDGPRVQLADGSALEPDAVISATGYRTALERIVGHLGVLDADGIPLQRDGAEAAPGLRFVGYRPVPAVLGAVGAEARRVAREARRKRGETPPWPPGDQSAASGSPPRERMYSS